MRNKFIQRILDMSPERRRHIRLGVKRGRYNRPRKEYSREEMIEWAREKNVKSKNGFFKVDDPGRPNFYYIIKEFGSWLSFKNAVWGCNVDVLKKIMGETPHDAEYIATVVAQYDLWNARDYERAHKDHPEIIPSVHWARYHFGRWSNLTTLAKHISLEYIVKRYMMLRDRYGRWPTYTECKNENIDLELLYEIHGGKKQLDYFLQRAMENINEDGRGSKREV